MAEMKQNPHCPYKSVESLEEWTRQRKLIMLSRDHDRHTCNCEGCRLYWVSAVGVGRSGGFYELKTIGGEGKTENEPAPYPLDLWHKDFIVALRFKTLLPERFIKVNPETGEKVTLQIFSWFDKKKKVVMRGA